MKNAIKTLILTILTILLIIIGLSLKTGWLQNVLFSPKPVTLPETENAVDFYNIPAWDGKSPYITINHNIPSFTKSDLSLNSYEYYSNLDELGRCSVAEAIISSELMPTEERGSIGMIKPTGWQSPLPKYDFIDGEFLYNICKEHCMFILHLL